MDRKKFFKISLTGIGSLALYKPLKALEYYPKTSDKKWAILYSTWCGSSRDAAVWISEGMGGIANVFDIRENPDLTGYDYLVIGGSIRSGVTSNEMQNYIATNKTILKTKLRGLFAVCGNMGNPVGPQQTSDFIENHLAKLCEVSSLPSKVFLGRITKSLMDSETAAMMAGATDYDNLKRNECMTFGGDVLNSLSTAIKTGSSLQNQFRLNQNYPQPFNQSTVIAYEIPKAGEVILAVYAISGEKVATLVSEYQEAGHYQVTWHASNHVAGNYLYCLKSGSLSETKEATLLH